VKFPMGLGAGTLAAIFVLCRGLSCVAAGCAVYLGAYLVGGTAYLTSDNTHLAALAVAAVVAASNVVNDIYDVDLDTVDKPWRPIPSGAIRVRWAWTLFWTLSATSSILGFEISRVSGWLVLLNLILGFVYSAALKGTFLVGSAVVAIQAGLSVAYGAIVHNGVPSTVWEASAIVSVYWITYLILITIRDAESDGEFNITTLATKLGPERASVCFHMGVAACVIAIALELCVVDNKAERLLPGVAFLAPLLVTAAMVGDGMKRARILLGIRLLRMTWLPSVVLLAMVSRKVT